MNDFPKSRRITSQKLIDALFGGGRNKSFAAFPLRAVWMVTDRPDATIPTSPIQILISVPKKRLHHAVDRNRVKRQLREAYRTQQSVLNAALPEDKCLSVAFLWQSDRHVSSEVVTARVAKILSRIAEIEGEQK